MTPDLKTTVQSQTKDVHAVQTLLHQGCIKDDPWPGVPDSLPNPDLKLRAQKTVVHSDHTNI